MTSRSASCRTGGRASASGCGRSAGCAASTPPARSCRRPSSTPTGGGSVAELAARGPFDGLELPRAAGAATLDGASTGAADRGRAVRGSRGGGRSGAAARRCRRRARRGNGPAGGSSGPGSGCGWSRARRRAGSATLAAVSDQTDAWAGLAADRRRGARRCWRGWCRSTSTGRSSRPGRWRAACCGTCRCCIVAAGDGLRAAGAALLCGRRGRRARGGDAGRGRRGRR